MEPDEMKKKARVGTRRAMMMGFAPFPVSSSRHQRSIFHRELLKSDSELMKWLRIRIESHWSLVSQDWNGGCVI